VIVVLSGRAVLTMSPLSLVQFDGWVEDAVVDLKVRVSAGRLPQLLHVNAQKARAGLKDNQVLNSNRV
jgi:hypothetical protein